MTQVTLSEEYSRYSEGGLNITENNYGSIYIVKDAFLINLGSKMALIAPMLVLFIVCSYVE